MNRSSVLMLYIVLFAFTCSPTANGRQYKPTAELLDAVQFSLPHLNPIAIQIENANLSAFPSQWTPEEAAFVRQFWNERGPRPPARQYVVYDDDGEIVAYRTSYDDGRQPSHRIAIYNWTDEACNNRLRLADAQIERVEALELAPDAVAEGVMLSDGVLTVPHQPAHSLRIVDLIEQKEPN